MEESASLRTVVRIRVPTDPATVATTLHGSAVVFRDGMGCHEYSIHAAYDHRTSLSSIFQAEVAPVIDKVAKGQKGTIFSYGATCSGKTYTMLGQGGSDPGIMLLSMERLLHLTSGASSGISCSFVELYDEEFYDLLSDRRRVGLAVEENGGCRLEGVREVLVNTVGDFENLLRQGSVFRQTRSTGLNQRSSRSHAIMQLSVQLAGAQRGRITMLDLAGTEDNRRTRNGGIALRESKSINLSLFQLNTVIAALHRGDAHIPYRDSKLTRILEDSLGGGTQSVIFSCISPQAVDLPEGLRVLAMTSAAAQIVHPPKRAHRTPVSSRAQQLETWRAANGRTPKRSTGSQLKKTPAPITPHSRSGMGRVAKTISFEADVEKPEQCALSNAQLTERRFLSFLESASPQDLQKLRHIGPAKAKMLVYVREKGLRVGSIEEFACIVALSASKLRAVLEDFSMWS